MEIAATTTNRFDKIKGAPLSEAVETYLLNELLHVESTYRECEAVSEAPDLVPL